MNVPQFGIAQSGDSRHAVLNGIVKALCRETVLVLEVGTFEGQSALVWSAAIAEHCKEGGHVLCVDPWSPDYLDKYLTASHVYGQMADGLRSGEVYARFVQNSKLASPRAPIYHMIGMLAKIFREQLQGRTFDIVYLDGDHAADAVREDIELARPLVRVGGILCGDDLERQGNEVDWEATKAMSNTTDYVGFHPGVTVAVWEAFGQVWSQNGVWAVRKTAERSWGPPGGV